MNALAPAFRLTAKQVEQESLSSGPARFVLAYGGSRSGKTFGFCRQIAARALKAPGSRHLIFRKTQAAAKTSLGGTNGTMPDVLRRRWPGLRYKYHRQEGLYVMPGGAEIWLAGLDSHNLERVLGNEYATIFGNELSEIPFGTFELLRSRLAQVAEQVVDDTAIGPLTQRFYGDLNPTTRSHWTYRVWRDLVHPVSGKKLDPEGYAWMRINPKDNAENLSTAFLADLMSLGPRARTRFWEGEYTADVEEALWRRSMIQITQRDVRELERIVVAVDPSISNEPGSDETGIVAAGIDKAKIGYVLADDSGRMRAEDWGRRAVALYHQLGADAIVAEVNQGGDLVENQIRAMVRSGEEQPRIRKVHATRGKYVRAEPIAGLYERGKVFHCDEFPELVDQMCSFTSDYDRRAQGLSPDRMDALVWAFTDLLGDMTKRKRKPVAPMPAAKGWMAA